MHSKRGLSIGHVAEDDRHDVATIMLFQAYNGGRPAEFIHVSKGKASQDPLDDAEEVERIRREEKGSPARTTVKCVGLVELLVSHLSPNLIFKSFILKAKSLKTASFISKKAFLRLCSLSLFNN